MPITVFPRTGATHRASAKLDHSSAPANSALCVAAMEGPMEMPVRQPQRGLMFAKRGPVSARVSARVTTTAPQVITASLQGVAAVRGSAKYALKPVSPCGIPSVDAMEELMEMRVRQLWPVCRSWQPGPALPSVHLRAGTLPQIFLGNSLRIPELSKLPQGFPAHRRRAFAYSP